MENNSEKIYIIGIGVDGDKYLTKLAMEKIEEAELIIGAKRMVEGINTSGKEVFISYNPDEQLAKIKLNNKKKIVILMSGDTGFFSGCKKIYEKLINENYSVGIISGISSAVYMVNKIGETWNDVAFVSLHGENNNIASIVRHNKKTFFLLGGIIDAKEVCKRLCTYNLGDTLVYIGENLGMKDEKITVGKAKDYSDITTDKLSVIFLKNTINKIKKIGYCDEDFIRGKVPMTKSEVRAICMSKLNLSEADICWDMGCGTGSVAIEMAIQADRGKVYAIDKNDEAIALTIENSKRFNLDNIIPIKRDIKNGLEDLERPDKVFIGGSSGNIGYIIKTAISKNPDCSFVITAVSLETINEAMLELERIGRKAEVTQIAVTRTKKVGTHTMLDSLNPIFIISH